MKQPENGKYYASIPACVADQFSGLNAFVIIAGGFQADDFKISCKSRSVSVRYDDLVNEGRSSTVFDSTGQRQDVFFSSILPVFVW